LARERHHQRSSWYVTYPSFILIPVCTNVNRNYGLSHAFLANSVAPSKTICRRQVTDSDEPGARLSFQVFLVCMPRSYYTLHARYRLSSGFLPSPTLRVVRYRPSPMIHPQVTVAIQTTLVTCRSAPRTSAKCSSNGMGPLDLNCQLQSQFHHLIGLELTFSVSHHLWLRDHCRCPDCFHSITKQRLINTFDVISSSFPHIIQYTSTRV
jgi:hypothetical protein